MRVFPAVAAVLALAALCSGCDSGVSDAELARRIEASRLTWQSYSEDIKAQLGAGPAAEWEGTLESVRVQPDRILVTFVLRGPWAQRSVAAPILLNEPLAGARQNDSAERNGQQVTYGFALPKGKAGMTVPWVELKFPGGHRRVALSEQGAWTAH